MPGLPGGTVTFLFTDIEGSTRRWDDAPAQMRVALARHDEILQGAISSSGGYVFKTIGDAFCAAFATAPDALSAALAAQQALFAQDWAAIPPVPGPQSSVLSPQSSASGPESSPLRVRMALHTGTVELQGEDYFGQPLNRVARLLSAAHGGQVLLSQPTYDLVRDSLPPGALVKDLGEHRLKDLQRPEHVYQPAAPGLPSEFPPIRTLDVHPNNLPLQPTALIGRERELAAVSALLARSDVRLVTLTGPGGAGKSRLGLQAAAEMLESFADGVWLVELATLPSADAHLVGSTIATALGVHEQPGQAIMDTIKAALREKQMLVVLDNFEQVASAAPQVGQLLLGCPGIKVIPTSRVPLRVRGEREFPVPPLSLPAAGTWRGMPAQSLTQYEAVRLFIERATDIKPDFEVDNDNAPAIAEICARLDGLPLAIELAAARVRLFPPHALLTRLSQRLKVLTGGARDLPARQQTLRNTIEWSYDLLTEGEKQLFRRMAVFSGGRTFEALEAVCSGGVGDRGVGAGASTVPDLEVDLLEGLESLVEKNLLQQREGFGDEPRFRMLETIQEYAWERLQESGEVETLKREHALYFMHLAEEAEPHLVSQKEVEWLNRLEDEHDNLLAALQWAREKASTDDEGATRAVEVGLRMAGAIWRFWYVKGYYHEGREQLDGLLSVGAATGCSRRVLARALNAASWLEQNRSVARSLAERALAIGKELGDKAIIATSLNNLGNIAWVQGEYGEARALHEESLGLRRELGDKQGIAASLNNLANLAINRGDYATTRALYEESQALWREIGNKGGLAISLVALGLVAYFQGDYQTARSMEAEGLALRRELGDKNGIPHSLRILAAIEAGLGDYSAARSLHRESLALGREMGAVQDVAMDLAGMANVAGHAGQPHRAARLLGAAHALNEATGIVPTPVDRALWYEGQGLTLARAQLGDEEFERTLADGRAMSMEEAIEYALRDDAE